MSAGARPSLAPHPGVARAALYDGSGLVRHRRMAVAGTVFFVLVLVLP